MDGVAISIIGRPRPLPGHDTPNPAHNTYTLKCEEPHYTRSERVQCSLIGCTISSATSSIADTLPMQHGHHN